MAPAALYLVIFQGIPLVQEFRLSFSRTSLLNPNDNVWVGFANFAKIFSSPDFQATLMTTFIYVVACVVGTVGVGLATALLLNGNFRGRGVARALISVPWAAPAVAVSLIATWMFNAQYGIVNRVLDVIGLGVPGGFDSRQSDPGPARYPCDHNLGTVSFRFGSVGFGSAICSGGNH